MIKCFKPIAVAVVVLICGLSTSAVMAQQAAPPKLRVIEFKGDLTMLLAALPNSFGVTVGLELDAQPDQLVRVSLLDPTLLDVMNAIVQSSNKYAWREVNGFVDVWPLTGNNPLLETTISNFNAKDLSPSQAFDQLFNLPEVQATMKAMNLKRRATEAPKKMTYNNYSVNLQGVSLRQALNKIAQESGIQIWVLRSYPNGYFSISTVDR